MKDDCGPLRRAIHCVLRIDRHASSAVVVGRLGDGDRGGIRGCPDLEIRREQESSFRELATQYRIFRPRSPPSA